MLRGIPRPGGRGRAAAPAAGIERVGRDCDFAFGAQGRGVQRSGGRQQRDPRHGALARKQLDAKHPQRLPAFTLGQQAVHGIGPGGRVGRQAQRRVRRGQRADPGNAFGVGFLPKNNETRLVKHRYPHTGLRPGLAGQRSGYP